MIVEPTLVENETISKSIESENKSQTENTDKELQRSINTYNMRYFPQHVILCTSTVHDQSGDICIHYSRHHVTFWICFVSDFYVSSIL